MTKVQIGTVNGSPVFTLQENNNAVFYTAGMTIDADGSPWAYNPDNTGLDDIDNAYDWEHGKRVLNGIVTDDDGNLVVQGPDDPAPGYYVSQTSLENTAYDETNPLRYVDAGAIPYIVLPSGYHWGQALGNYCIVYNTANNQWCGGIYADDGPPDHIGEGSIKTAVLLGFENTSPRDGGADSGIIYLFFKGETAAFPLDNTAIQTKAKQLLDALGGIGQLTGLFVASQAPTA